MASPTTLQRLDPLEVQILQKKGAFSLPSKAIQDELIDLFFTWIAPILPVIQKSDFMRRYRDPLNPPSLLLLQAVFISVSRFASQRIPGDGEGTESKIFFRRAKALYDAGYERDPVTVVQALVLMSWYWHGAQDVTENGLFYWSRLAIAVAQDCDMHRSAELTHLTQPERRLYKRIWWTLFTRDRTVSVAYGRPVSIRLEHSNVNAIAEDDFVEEGETPNSIHVHFFIQYVELTKILHMAVLRPIEQRENSHGEVDVCEYELDQWLLNCPEIMQWTQSRHEFWASLLHYAYNTVLCLLHGPQGTKSTKVNRSASQAVSSQAASMILSTAECLISHGQMKFAPPSLLYSIFTVLATVKEQLSSPIPSLVLQCQRKVNTCRQILEAMSSSWPIARMMNEIAEHVFSEKKFKEMIEASTPGFGREAGEVTTSKQKYKRAVPTPGKSRPEMMLPKTRVTVKMLLTTLKTGQNRDGNRFPISKPTQPWHKSQYDDSCEWIGILGSQQESKSLGTENRYTGVDQDGPPTLAAQDVAEANSDPRRKVPRRSYMADQSAERQGKPADSQQGVAFFDRHSSAILPPISDWGIVATPSPNEQLPQTPSLDFEQWESFSDLEADLKHVTRTHCTEGVPASLDA